MLCSWQNLRTEGREKRPETPVSRRRWNLPADRFLGLRSHLHLLEVARLASGDQKYSKRDAGRLGARRRWGDQPRVVRLDELSPEQRAVVIALINAHKSANESIKASVDVHTKAGSLSAKREPAARGGHRNDQPAS